MPINGTRHDCLVWVNGKRVWALCCICEGRIHQENCTSKRNRQKDCCAARHKMLHDSGQRMGIIDSSYVMWAANYPEGYHPHDESYKFLKEIEE